MHYVTESATINLRERKMQETATRLTSVSRRMTADHGLGGFTIEELCAEVDVSRRTFFNYFASKEDAVIGADADEESQRFAEEYLAQGARGWGRVVDDLIELVSAHFESSHIDMTGHSDFMRAIEREPRLLARFIGISRDRERQVAALIADREGVPHDDARAVAAVTVLATLLRSSADRLLDPLNTLDFSTIISQSLAAMRAVLTPPTSGKAQS